MKILFQQSVQSFWLFLTLSLFISCKPKEKIRIGLNAWPGYEFLYLAQFKGINKELGVDSDIIVFNSLADGRRSFERGEIDVLGTTIIEAILVKNNSKRDPKIIYVTDYSNGADVLLVQSKYKSIKELKGKSIGVETGSVCIYTLYLALQKHGLKLEDVKIIEADQDTIEKGLRNKTLDGGVTYPPFSINLFRDKSLRVVYSSKESPMKIVDVVIAQKEAIKQRKEDLNKVLIGFEKARALTFTPDSSQVAISIMAQRENISPDEFKTAITEDMTILTREDQKGYFKGGLLVDVINDSFKALKITGQVNLEQFDASSLMENIQGE